MVGRMCCEFLVCCVVEVRRCILVYSVARALRGRRINEGGDP